MGGTDVDASLAEANRRVIETLAFEDGIAHSEWRVTDTGDPYLMEIAVRTPGDGLTKLYELACGQPLEPEIIRIALGEKASYPLPQRYARQVYLEHRPGRLREVTLDWPGVEPVWLGESDLWPSLRPGEIDDAPSLRAVLVQKEKGSHLNALRSYDDRAVTFFIDARTEAEAGRAGTARAWRDQHRDRRCLGGDERAYRPCGGPCVRNEVLHRGPGKGAECVVVDPGIGVFARVEQYLTDSGMPAVRAA